MSKNLFSGGSFSDGRLAGQSEFWYGRNSDQIVTLQNPGGHRLTMIFGRSGPNDPLSAVGEEIIGSTTFAMLMQPGYRYAVRLTESAGAEAAPATLDLRKTGDRDSGVSYSDGFPKVSLAGATVTPPVAPVQETGIFLASSDPIGLLAPAGKVRAFYLDRDYDLDVDSRWRLRVFTVPVVTPRYDFTIVAGGAEVDTAAWDAVMPPTVAADLHKLALVTDIGGLAAGLPTSQVFWLVDEGVSRKWRAY